MCKTNLPDKGWRKKGTATKLLSVRKKMLTDKKRVNFAKGTWWDTANKIDAMREGEDKSTQMGCLVKHFVEFLTSNEFYFLRNCWDNTSLCKYYRRYADKLYWSCESTGLDDLCDVIDSEVLALILRPHKDDMDDPKHFYVDFSIVRDEMIASMRRLRKWLEATH